MMKAEGFDLTALLESLRIVHHLHTSSFTRRFQLTCCMLSAICHHPLTNAWTIDFGDCFPPIVLSACPLWSVYFFFFNIHFQVTWHQPVPCPAEQTEQVIWVDSVVYVHSSDLTRLAVSCRSQGSLYYSGNRPCSLFCSWSVEHLRKKKKCFNVWASYTSG